MKPRGLRRQDAIAAAEGVAVEALGFLAADSERLSRFVELSGLDPANLRGAARQPGFLAGVLDHIAADESLLITFAANAGKSPEEVARACALLSGRDGYEPST